MKLPTRAVKVMRISMGMAAFSGLTLWSGIADHDHLRIWLSGACAGIAIFCAMSEGIGLIIGGKMMLHFVPREPGE